MNGIPDILPDLQKMLGRDPMPGGIPDPYMPPRRTGIQLFRSSKSPVDRYYINGNPTAATKASSAVYSANTIYAYPFVSMQGGWVDKLIINITVAGSANSHIRWGVYTSKMDRFDPRTQPAPDLLLFDSGGIAGNVTGVQTANCNIYFEPGKLYYLCILRDGTTSPTLRTIPAGETPMGYFVDASPDVTYGWQQSFTYGALPGLIGTNPQANNATPTPAIGVHFKDDQPYEGGYSSLKSYGNHGSYDSSNQSYFGGVQIAGAQTATTSFSNALLYFVPFCFPAGGFIATIRLGGTATAGQTCRLGLYSNVSNDFLYPDQLIYDSGDISTNSSSATGTPGNPIYIEPDRLYWLAYCVSSAAVPRRSIAASSQYNLLGFSNGIPATGNHSCGRAMTFTYGALPGAIPPVVAGTSDNSVIPGINVFMRPR
jgi:hypothetical protein